MAESPKTFTFLLQQSHLKSIRSALNLRMAVITDKYSNTTDLQQIARYRNGGLELAALENIIANSIRRDMLVTRLTLTEKQCGIAAHAVMHARREKKAASSVPGLDDLQETDKLNGLAAIEKIFKESLPTYLLRYVGYGDDELQLQANTLYDNEPL
jgi:hypothetical protein